MGENCSKQLRKGQVWFTDGACNQQKICKYQSKIQWHISLGRVAKAFQSEVAAILDCVTSCLKPHPDLTNIYEQMWTNKNLSNVDNVTSVNKQVRSITSPSNKNKCDPTTCWYIKGGIGENANEQYHYCAFVFKFKSIYLLLCVQICSHSLVFVNVC